MKKLIVCLLVLIVVAFTATQWDSSPPTDITDKAVVGLQQVTNDNLVSKQPTEEGWGSETVISSIELKSYTSYTPVANSLFNYNQNTKSDATALMRDGQGCHILKALINERTSSENQSMFGTTRSLNSA